MNDWPDTCAVTWPAPTPVPGHKGLPHRCAFRATSEVSHLRFDGSFRYHICRCGSALHVPAPRLDPFPAPYVLPGAIGYEAAE